MSAENISKFVELLSESLQKQTFVKLTLGNYRGKDPHLQKLLIRLVKTKKGSRLFFLYRFDTRDTAKNFDQEKALNIIIDILGKDFFSGHLFTVENDHQLDIGKKGRSRLNKGKPTFKSLPSIDHDREKNILVDPNSFYLKALGITTDRGEIRAKQHDKWKQINKFIETLDNLFENSPLADRRKLRIVDMGSGKGYLTFATYDHFKNSRGLDVEVIGVDTKDQLVRLGNDIARSSEFTGLSFVNGFIDNFDLKNTDILIALHACNTATDDAIFKGIKAGADLIVCAPCCHQQLRPQIKPPAMLKDVLKHGIMLEREAETLTDGLRALLLEESGYKTKVFEFISTEHTPKNNMIVGIKSDKTIDESRIRSQIEKIKSFYSIQEQRLDELLSANRNLPELIA
ncbi:MAG: SAM-dependent methyltransferase [Pyrinomonadaceae bacterium]|nr:SAM-dependent methyltransferase [Pyrinomonadaceae bacterium]